MLTEETIAHLLSECSYKTARSSGKGGQNVNKVETKVELFFSIPDSEALDEVQKATLLAKYPNRIDKEGTFHLSEEGSRSQQANKEAVREKLILLIEAGLRPKKARKATKPSKSAKEKRLKTKKKTSERKQMRRRTDD